MEHPHKDRPDIDEKAFVLLSLEARTFSFDYLRELALAATELNLTHIEFWALDNLEYINLVKIYGLTALEAQLLTEDRVARIRSDVARLPISTSFHLASEVSDSPEWQSVYSWITEALAENRSLRNKYRNQCFTNLHPVFRRAGVRHMRGALVEQTYDYLLKEETLRILLTARHGMHDELAPYESDGLLEKLCQQHATKCPIDVTALSLRRRRIPSLQAEGGVSCDSVCFAYSGRTKRQTPFALSECTLSVDSGTICGLFGPSGSGKSTLMRIIGGHLNPDSGSIVVGTHDVTRERPGKRGTVTVFQDHGLFAHLSVRDNVGYGLVRATTKGRAVRDTLVNSFLQRLELAEIADHYPTEVSVGQRQRVAIARALITEPQVLLLDEPTASLDHLQRERLIRMLEVGLSGPRRPAVLIVSHDRDFLFSICSHVYIMDNGKIIAGDRVDNLLDDPPNLRAAHLLGTHGWARGVMSKAGFYIEGMSSPMFLEHIKPLPNGDQSGHLLIPPSGIRLSPPGNVGGESRIRLRVHSLRISRGMTCIQFDCESENDSKLSMIWDMHKNDGRAPAIGDELEVELLSTQCRFLPDNQENYHEAIQP